MATASAQCDIPDDRALVAYLEYEAFGHTKRIDTHAAHIFLSDDRAWKIKQRVDLGFLDFSTPDKRKAALQAELDLNRRTAPDLYLALHSLTRTDDGFSIDGSGPIVDWALEMRRFPDDALLDHRAQTAQLDTPLLMQVAEVVQAFHDTAEIAWDAFPEIDLLDVIAGNDARFNAVVSVLPRKQTLALTGRQSSALHALTALLATRAARGRVRHVHGDLHLRNIAIIKGVPVPFDCLEFDTRLATIDVAYDLAFLLMDLWHRGLCNEANIVYNRYTDLSPEDEDAGALLPLFLSLRASIRAHVLATQALQGDEDARAQATSYLDLAIDLLRLAPPRLVAIGGLSGTGKSTVARMLGGLIGSAPGARILRSDVLRKRTAGLKPEQKLPRSAYTPEAAKKAYHLLADAVEGRLEAGTSVIVDAAFADRAQRDLLTGVAASIAVPFDGLCLYAALETRLERVRNRASDASDADEAVVRAQPEIDLAGDSRWNALAADGSPGTVAANARALLSHALA